MGEGTELLSAQPQRDVLHRDERARREVARRMAEYERSPRV